MVERLLLTSEICGSNPVIGKIYLPSKKTKIKKKRPGLANLKNFDIKFYVNLTYISMTVANVKMSIQYRLIATLNLPYGN